MDKILHYFKGENGQIEVYSDKLVITRKGFNVFSMRGAGNKTIPFSSIKSIQFSQGTLLRFGYIQFGIDGGIEMQGGAVNAAYDENSVTFEKKINQEAQQFKEVIEDLIFNKFKSNTSNNFQQTSSADEILKLKELLDNEIITKEEFEIKKNY